MLKFDAAEFLRAFATLSSLKDIMRDFGGDDDDPKKVSAYVANAVKGELVKLRISLAVLDANLTDMIAERLLKVLENEGANRASCVRAIEDLNSRLRDELSLRHLYVVPNDQVKYFAPKAALFGPEVEARFPLVSEDLECAGKCLALSQPTACVFHLMRMMEAIVGELCTFHQIANPDREWGKLLSDLSKKIEAMPKGKLRNEWSEAHSNLYHVKQAWRNETMHPKQTYTMDQAEDVFRAMRTFSTHLAGLLT